MQATRGRRTRWGTKRRGHDGDGDSHRRCMREVLVAAEGTNGSEGRCWKVVGAPMKFHCASVYLSCVGLRNFWFGPKLGKYEKWRGSLLSFLNFL